jgi:hypothetical protein
MSGNDAHELLPTDDDWKKRRITGLTGESATQRPRATPRTR